MQFTIGAISLKLDGIPFAIHGLKSDLAKFQSECWLRDPDIRVDVTWTDQLRPSADRKAFESGGPWNLFRDDSDFVFEFTSPATGPYPDTRIRTDQAFKCVEVILSREALKGHRGFFPLEYPADELLFTNHLAFHSLGVEVHGCGVVDRDGEAFLFLGHSGTGKSTTARLWDRLRSPEILSDDRIILRFYNGELWMYGTPWHGDAGFASQNCAKLKRIFILRQAVRNEVTLMPKALAAGELFARSFPPFHSSDGLERSMAFLHSVVDHVPCYDFGFVPDGSAVETALEFHD